jgi:hypothetical protein
VVLAIVTAILGGRAATTSSHATRQHTAVAVKGESDSWADKAGIANEGPDGTWAAAEEAQRAYPADSVPASAAADSLATFQSLKAHGKQVGQWQSIGPDKAQYPAVLNPFLFDGAAYTASGRVTAMAIAPSCAKSKCRLYVGAAGGGVWVTDKALNGEDVGWQFVGGSLGTNAIGSILLDPSDPSGNTVYVGTGEPNASGDSEAGVGIFKTTDGGQSWALVPGSGVFCQRAVSSLALDKDGNLLAGIASSVRGVSSVTGGSSSSASSSCPLITRGVYRQTGSTFTLLRATNIRGTTEVGVDPNNPNVLYQSSFAEGIWRSLNNGATWTQILPALNPLNNADRATFAVNALPNGKTRMYVGDGNTSTSAANLARFFRTDDAAGAASFTDMTTDQNRGYCSSFAAGAQCWYDNVVYSPPGAPDVVYLGGSFDYDNIHGRNNGRAWLLSTDGGQTFTDLTQDADPNHAEAIHPDQHAIVTLPAQPLTFITGSDGGVVRSDGQYGDVSSKCDSRGLDAAGTAFCKSMLSRVPNQLVPINKGLSTLQFQSLSVSPKSAKLLMGGTQDNGTFQFNGSGSVWPQIIYGDGGQSGFNAADDSLRFNTFSGQASDVNFRKGDPTAWVIATGPIRSSPEGSNFYPPIIADPTTAFAGSIFQGSQSVWRTQDWAGDQAYLEANCPEFTTSAANPACGDFVRLGPAGARDLTAPNAVDPSTTFGSAADRAGGAVAAIERAPSNTGTMWAATNTGRVFITDNANASDPTAVAWTRLDQTATNDPARFVSSIYIDPANPNHVWLSYTGYNVNTPAQPGHVFEVNRIGGTATWTDRTYNLADLPVTDLVRDDLTGDLYASTDFGVWTLPSGSTTWVATGGMPMVEVAGLTIVPGARVLYAATHGLGAWEFDLPRVK